MLEFFIYFQGIRDKYLKFISLNDSFNYTTFRKLSLN